MGRIWWFIMFLGLLVNDVRSPRIWWRYATEIEQNGYIIDDLPLLKYRGEHFIHHCTGDININPVADNKVIAMSRFDDYLDKRHFKVCTVGSLLRETNRQILL